MKKPQGAPKPRPLSSFAPNAVVKPKGTKGK